MEEIGRADIQYRKSGGRHVIIELKRAGVATETIKLLTQVQKYQRKMKQLLSHTGRDDEEYDIICIVGKDLADWKEPAGRQQSREMLETVRARVVTYDQMTGNAQRAYNDYLEASEKAGRIHNIIAAIDNELTLAD